MYYVTMTDRFFSGWGKARNKTAKYVVICETWEQAEQIEKAANKRDEMKYVNIRLTKPYYNDNYQVTFRNFNELGGVWLKGWKG